MRNVLCVLEQPEERFWSTFATAIDLAERERARLTLVTGREPGRVYTWCAAFMVGALYVPPDGDPDQAAAQLLARVAEFVPGDIPVTTMVLSQEPKRDLRRLIRSGAYDALVADEHLLRRAWLLRGDSRKHEITTIGSHVLPGSSPHDGGVIAVEVPATERHGASL